MSFERAVDQYLFQFTRLDSVMAKGEPARLSERVPEMLAA
jgi:hypothetical protein